MADALSLGTQYYSNVFLSASIKMESKGNNRP